MFYIEIEKSTEKVKNEYSTTAKIDDLILKDAKKHKLLVKPEFKIRNKPKRNKSNLLSDRYDGGFKVKQKPNAKSYQDFKSYDKRESKMGTGKGKWWFKFD